MYPYSFNPIPQTNYDVNQLPGVHYFQQNQVLPDRQPPQHQQLERRVDRLERENDRQTKEIERMNREINQLQRRLQRVNQRLRAVERRFNFPFTPFEGEY